jgi:phosphoribosylpyrophosphate synthetase
MRLTKTAYLYGNAQVISYDEFGRPIYGDPQKIPFSFEKEPYSSEKAQRDYGVSVVSVQYRMFTNPDTSLQINKEIEYNGKVYSIADPPKDYDNHYEILIKYERDI